MWERPGSVVIERGHAMWPGIVGWLLPVLFLVALVAFGVWAVRRITDVNPPMVATAGAPAPPPIDPAIHELRLRYARGEVDPDEFAQRSRDLGGEGPEPPPPTPPDAA